MSSTDLAFDTSTAAGPGHPGQWVSLRLLNSYRLFVALVLLVAFFSPITEFGRAAPFVFYGFSSAYLIAGLLFALLLLQRRPPATTQAYLHFFVDVVALNGAIYASGGADSGLGILLLVPVAGAGILLPTRYALLYASLAALMALTSEVVRHQTLGGSAADYPGAALLGATLFATALLAALLARRSAQVAHIARQRMADIRHLTTLNERIIQQMESGILVVGLDGTIKLANASANVLLERDDIVPGETLAELAPGLAQRLATWVAEPHTPLPPVAARPEAQRRLHAQFTDLGDLGTLISLEDAAHIEEQLQQLKLASLGRLSASIAHEIRNPLSAIRHSTQLLSETETLSAEDQRLVEIQLQHCNRINRIVEDVLVVSRRRTQPGDTVQLHEWLAGFVREFRDTRALDEEHVTLRETGSAHGDALVTFDAGQLRQVLSNLCDNALKHGQRPNGDGVTVALEMGNLSGDQPYLDIADDGVPIAHSRVEELFEPFYSTSRTGTGLGLFVARELCASNNARLRHIAEANGNRFRILFESNSRDTHA